MKQWTFFSTLMLFLIFLNFGIFIFSVFTFKDTTKRAMDRSLAEHYFIVSTLTKDFDAVESRGSDLDDSIFLLFQSFSCQTENSKTGLVLYKEDQIVYSNQNVSDMPKISPKSPMDVNRFVTMQKKDNRTYVIVSGKLPDPYNNYTLIYLYDTTVTINSWNYLKNMLFLAGFILSILLSLGLYFILNRIFRPLSQISQTSKDIAKGDYETRLRVTGHDELTEMAQSFNHMTEEIQFHMTELKEAADKKQQFVDNFAHELRTPLTAIYGYAEYMQKAVLNEDDRLVSLQYIMSESRRLQTMAYQLLSLANLQNNPIIFEKIKISELFLSAGQSLCVRLEEKGIRIDFCSQIETITGDASLLESLLINLIDNAIKACKTNDHIMVSADLEEGKKIICVQDNGKGMTQEVLSQITEPFYRGEKSRNRSDGGAGLGLAICSQIALSHGANLEFASELGEGTQAKITFTTS